MSSAGMKFSYLFVKINILAIFKQIVSLINLGKCLQTWRSNCIVDYSISLRVTCNIFKKNEKMINYLIFIFCFFFSNFSIWTMLLAYDLETRFWDFTLNIDNLFQRWSVILSLKCFPCHDLYLEQLVYIKIRH